MVSGTEKMISDRMNHAKDLVGPRRRDRSTITTPNGGNRIKKPS